MEAIIKVKLHGYSDNPVHDALAYKLAHLAGKWRETKDDTVAEQYQTILRTLILMGFDEELPVDAELPDRLLPQEYLDLFTD